MPDKIETWRQRFESPVTPVCLIVEDDEGDMEILSHLMREAGFAVIPAKSGEEAVNLLFGHFDLLLLNLCLPGMSGMEFLIQFRRAQPGVPCVVVTGFDPGCLQVLGIAHVFSKPFTRAHRDQLLSDFQLAYESEGHCPVPAGYSGRTHAVA